MDALLEAPPVRRARTSHEESLNHTAQSASSGTTGLSSYNITNGYIDLDLEERRDENEKPGSGVDQGADNLEPPRALYTVGGDLPHTGYEPKPSSTRVVDGAQRTRSASESIARHSTRDEPKPSSTRVTDGVIKQAEDKKNPNMSTASTTSVPCAGGNSGKVKRERSSMEEPWSVRIGQSDSREYGTEIFELEEKIQNLAIKEEKSMHALCDELLKFSSKEEVDLLRQTLGQDITDAQEHTEDWGNYIDNKFNEYLLVDEFENLFTKTTEDIKEQEANLRAKTMELDEMVREMKMAMYDRPLSSTADNGTNAQTINEVGSLQDDIKRFQHKMIEDINEVKKEIYEKVDREMGLKIRT